MMIATFPQAAEVQYLNGTYMFLDLSMASGRGAHDVDEDLLDIEWDYDESLELLADADFMRHFEAGVGDLDAGRLISADDLERELGL
jgi:hypothetical protein